MGKNKRNPHSVLMMEIFFLFIFRLCSHISHNEKLGENTILCSCIQSRYVTHFALMHDAILVLMLVKQPEYTHRYIYYNFSTLKCVDSIEYGFSLLFHCCNSSSNAPSMHHILCLTCTTTATNEAGSTTLVVRYGSNINSEEQRAE